jgi:Zn-dependent protease
MDTSLSLGKIFGIEVKLDWSWFFIFFLLTWALATGLFPQLYGFTGRIAWILGAGSAVLLFASVLFHEISHSLVARRHKIKVESITLFFFGGVAGMSAQANLKPKTEFYMAFAGPLFSIGAGVFFFVLTLLPLNIYLAAVFDYLYKINFILAFFNLVPGYPLDGGRMLRAIIWGYTGDVKKATRYAATGGRVFGALLIFTGIFAIISGFGGGLWYILIGGFIYFLAGASYQQLMVKEILTKVKIREVIHKKYLLLKPSETVNQYLKDCLKYDHDSFLVKVGKTYKVITINDIQMVPKNQRSKIKIHTLAKDTGSLKENDTVFKALDIMNTKGVTLLPVLRNKKLVGVVEANTLANVLKIKSLGP